MLGCDETVTFVRRVPGMDSDTYVCTVINGVSWYGKLKLVAHDNGVKSVVVVKTRIPVENLPEGFVPQKGDYVCRGIIESVQKPADLKGVEHFVAMLIGDNRRGSMPHWAVSGNA